MPPKTEEAAADPDSYEDSGAPSVTVDLLTGQRFCWLMHQIGRIEYRPRGFQATDEEHRKWETIVMRVGGGAVVIWGFDLLQVHSGFASGQGGVLHEKGARYAALKKNGKPYVCEIKVEMDDDD